MTCSYKQKDLTLKLTQSQQEHSLRSVCPSFPLRVWAESKTSGRADKEAKEHRETDKDPSMHRASESEGREKRFDVTFKCICQEAKVQTKECPTWKTHYARLICHIAVWLRLPVAGKAAAI